MSSVKTKLRAGPSSESSNAILSYKRNSWLWLKSIPHSSIEGNHVHDVRDYYTKRISQSHTQFLNFKAITNLEYKLLLNIGAVCSKDETENDLLEGHWGDAIANTFVIAWWGVRRVATVPFSLEVNYKIVKKKIKIEEKIPVWKRVLSLNLDEIEIGWGL